MIRRRLNPPPPEIADPLTKAFGKRAPYVFDEVMKVLHPPRMSEITGKMWTPTYEDLGEDDVDQINEHLGAIYELAFFTPSMRKNKKSPYLQTVVQWYVNGAINWDRPWEDVPQNLELLKEFHSRVQSGEIKGEAAKPKRYETPGEMIAVLDTGITSSQLNCAGANLRGEIHLDPDDKTKLGPRIVRLWKVSDYDTFMRCKGDWKVSWCLTQRGTFEGYAGSGDLYMLTVQDNDIDRPEAMIYVGRGDVEYKDRGNSRITEGRFNNVHRYDFWEPTDSWLNEARVYLDEYGDEVWPLLVEEIGTPAEQMEGEFAGIDIDGAIQDARSIIEHPEWVLGNLSDYTNDVGKQILEIVSEYEDNVDSKKSDRWEGGVVELLGMCGDGFCAPYDEPHLLSVEESNANDELYDLGLKRVVEGLKKSLRKKRAKEHPGQQRLFSDAAGFTDDQWVEVAQELLRSSDPKVLDYFAQGIIDGAEIPYSPDGYEFVGLIPVPMYLEFRDATAGEQYVIAAHILGIDYGEIDTLIEKAKDGDRDALYELWIWSWENAYPEQEMHTDYPEGLL